MYVYLSADITGVWLDPGVEAHMPRQHVAARKAPLAHAAVVRLRAVAARRSAAAAGCFVAGSHVL